MRVFSVSLFVGLFARSDGSCQTRRQGACAETRAPTKIVFWNLCGEACPNRRALRADLLRSSSLGEGSRVQLRWLLCDATSVFGVGLCFLRLVLLGSRECWSLLMNSCVE